MRSIFLTAALLVAAPLATRAEAADSTITIDNFSFAPAQLDVAAGTRVTWLNRDDIPHQVVGVENPKDLKSPPLDTDDHYAYVFAKPGIYHYFCSLHAHMQGTVVVK